MRGRPKRVSKQLTFNESRAERSRKRINECNEEPVVKKSRILVHTAQSDDHDDDQSKYLICYLGIAGARKLMVIWTKCCSAGIYKHV